MPSSLSRIRERSNQLVALSTDFSTSSLFNFFHLAADPIRHLHQDHIVSRRAEHGADVVTGREDTRVREILLLPCPDCIERRAAFHFPSEDRVQPERLQI